LALSPKLLRQFLIWLVVGIAVYGATVAFSGAEEMGAALARIGVAGWAAVFGLSTINIALRFCRWQYYLNTMGYAVPVRNSLQYFIAGFAFTSTPAKAGEAVRSLYLKNREGVKYPDSLAALFVERLTDLLAVVLFALAAAYSIESMRWLVIAAGIATLALLPLIHSSWLRNMLERWRVNLQPGKLRNGIGYIMEMIQSSAALLQSGPLYGGMFLSILAALCVCMMMHITLLLLGADVSMSLAIGIYATGILAGALSFMPGGIGSAEAVMLGLLVLVGVDAKTALAAIFVCRIAALWYAIAIGIIIVLRLEMQPGKPQESTEIG
jgi:uncharacterized protein (TIRG00374 family)